MNTRTQRVAAGAALALLALTPSAFAAAPTHGGLYIGQGSTKKIALRVSSSGKHYTARLYCFRQSQGTISGAITRGTFSGHKSTGGTLLWSIRGSFSSKDAGKVTLHIGSLCDGHGGHLGLALAPS
jgi:hypothetical protein